MAKIINQDIPNTGTDLLLKDPEMPIESIVFVSKEIPRTEEITFINNRDSASPTVPLEFHYHSKTHPLKRYTLYSGKNYTLPVEIIQHLEGQGELDPYSCHKREYAERMGPNGTELYVNNYVSYYQCRRVRK
jgi:hypothetical protein